MTWSRPGWRCSLRSTCGSRSPNSRPARKSSGFSSPPSRSMRARSTWSSAPTARPGASPRCRTCSGWSRRPRCSPSRCSSPTTSSSPPMPMAASSSARRRSPSTGCSRSSSSACRGSPTARPRRPPAQPDGAGGRPVAALVVAGAAEVEVLLRAIESGAVQRLRVVGVLSPADGDLHHSVRGIRVVGRPADLEAVVARYEAGGTPVRRIIFAASALAPEARPGADARRRPPPRHPDQPPAVARRAARTSGWRRSIPRTSCCARVSARRRRACETIIRDRRSS